LTSSYFSVKMHFIKACVYVTGQPFGIKLFHHFPLDFQHKDISQRVPENRTQGKKKKKKKKKHNCIPRAKHIDEANCFHKVQLVNCLCLKVKSEFMTQKTNKTTVVCMNSLDKRWRHVTVP
jgi:hypothetical protein